jgi:hypothetical protein
MQTQTTGMHGKDKQSTLPQPANSHCHKHHHHHHHHPARAPYLQW